MVKSAKRFRLTFGVVSAKSWKTMRPDSRPPIVMSKNTCGCVYTIFEIYRFPLSFWIVVFCDFGCICNERPMVGLAEVTCN